MEIPIIVIIISLLILNYFVNKNSQLSKQIDRGKSLYIKTAMDEYWAKSGKNTLIRYITKETANKEHAKDMAELYKDDQLLLRGNWEHTQKFREYAERFAEYYDEYIKNEGNDDGC